MDRLDDLCGALTGGVGITGVIHDADRLLGAEQFPFGRADLTVTTGDATGDEFVAVALTPGEWR